MLCVVEVRRNDLEVAGGTGGLTFQLQCLDRLGKYVLSGTDEEKASPEVFPISFSGSRDRDPHRTFGATTGCTWSEYGSLWWRKRVCVSAVPEGKLLSKPPRAARSQRCGEFERNGLPTLTGEQCGGLPYLLSAVQRPPPSVSRSASSCKTLLTRSDSVRGRVRRMLTVPETSLDGKRCL